MSTPQYQAVDCSAISQVPHIESSSELNDLCTLVLVSVPYAGADEQHSTPEDYISKSATLRDLTEHFNESL